MKCNCLFIALFVVSLCGTIKMQGQSLPNMPTTQLQILPGYMDLNFGSVALINGNLGGSVTVSWDGKRTPDSNVVFPGVGTFQAALVQFKLCPGRMVTISYPSQISLTGAAHGQKIEVDLGDNSKGLNGCSFATNGGGSEIHTITIGGTLVLKPRISNVSDVYSSDGSFTVTFVQQ